MGAFGSDITDGATVGERGRSEPTVQGSQESLCTCVSKGESKGFQIVGLLE